MTTHMCNTLHLSSNTYHCCVNILRHFFTRDSIYML